MKVSDLEFTTTKHCESDYLHAVNLDDGSRITVLDRETGRGYGTRDIETGYSDPECKFCLASGGFDIRNSGDISVEEAIKLIKEASNKVPWNE